MVQGSGTTDLLVERMDRDHVRFRFLGCTLTAQADGDTTASVPATGLSGCTLNGTPVTNVTARLIATEDHVDLTLNGFAAGNPVPTNVMFSGNRR